ncbi:hypothetical protein L1049_026226 [Liquidambar formosana]|uniref:Uncharacterized protein n=1 Tax=Liquidambar formosana TaxID=63359 RepID=A0AAP0R744_LIQFO
MQSSSFQVLSPFQKEKNRKDILLEKKKKKKKLQHEQMECELSSTVQQILLARDSLFLHISFVAPEDSFHFGFARGSSLPHSGIARATTIASDPVPNKFRASIFSLENFV